MAYSLSYYYYAKYVISQVLKPKAAGKLIYQSPFQHSVQGLTHVLW